jgi:DNA mismatch repair protein MutS
LAKVAKERGYCKPEIVEGEASGISALALRHPLLESIQTRIQYVKHDVSLGFDKESGWLLYGMNASGKSSLMKSIGICVLLAQAGCYVPAAHLKLKPFKSILTRILNQDNLWAGLSSFAVEVSELRDIFQKADEYSLVLGDELCSGTESISATSLVAAGIQYLHEKQSRFVFATHLHDLNKLPEIEALPRLGIWHLRVHYDAATDKLIYDRTLHRGPGGTLYGLEVARAMHLPHEILKQAIAYRKRLLGESSLEESDMSSWNSQVLRKVCEICSCSIVRDLEVHHIKPRAQAQKGRFEDGSSMNDIRNLIVVCQTCHDKHHTGELNIGPQVQTSAGPQRVAQHVASTAKKIKVKWTEEEQQTIESYLRKFPHLPLTRLVYELKQQEDIEISASALSKLKASLV